MTEPVNKIVYPTRSLLQGGNYTPSASSDIRARFAAMKQQQPKTQQLRRAK